jgi:hypothetical protein
MRPWDLAVFGQMLLNRGSYGNLQFLTPDNFQRMLPSPDWGPPRWHRTRPPRQRGPPSQNLRLYHQPLRHLPNRPRR